MCYWEFCEKTKAYRLYDPVAKKIVISRDVVFEEDKSWNWDASYEQHVAVNLECDDGNDNDAVATEYIGDVRREEDVTEEPIGDSLDSETG